MKPLFICNSENVFGFKNYIQNSTKFNSIKSLDHCFITSLEELKARNNDILGKGDTPFTKIYIVPELTWNEELYYGYKVGFGILKGWKNKQAPGLTFVSMLSQKKLDNLVQGKLNSLVREFIHIDLLQIENIGLPTKTFSNSRWKYLKTYALTRSGILDEISHDLTTLQLQKGNIEKSFLKVINRIKSLSDTVGKEAIDLINKYEIDNNNPKFIKELNEAIDNRLNELSPHNAEGIDIPLNMNILIIEDNLEHQNIIEQSLTRNGYFEKNKTLFCYNNGKNALNELKSSRNQYQLVLVDLRLNDEDGFAQPVHGVDIIDELRKNHPLSSYTIITGMGRKGISELLNIDVRFVLSKKQLYSFDTDSEVDTMLSRMFEDLKQREKSVHYNFGPNKTIYGWTMFKTNLFALGIESIQEQIAIADNKLQLFKNKELNETFEIPSQKQQSKFDMATIGTVHTNILSLRRIFIWLALKNYNKLYLSNKEQGEYQQILDDNDIKINKSRVDSIGLHYKSLKTEKDISCFRLELDKLWPHEQKIVKEWNEKHKEVYLDYLQDIIISEKYPSLYRFIKTYFNYKDVDFQQYKLNIPNETNVWNFKDLGHFLTTIFDDCLSKKEKSLHYVQVVAMLEDDYVMNYFEQQIAPYLPEVDKKFSLLYDTID